MNKLLYITNIPTPYRQKRFNRLSEILLNYKIELEVLYMAETEPNRNWNLSKDTFKYKYKIYKGLHPVIGHMFAHFNPSLLLRLLKNDYNIAIVGGMASPTHMLAPFFIRSSKIQIMSIESNLHSVKITKGVGALIKRTLLKKATAFQVTGTPQIDYIKYFYPKALSRKFIKLPNLIDENIFVEKVSKLRRKRLELRKLFEVNAENQMWLLPSRLINIKGIIPFIKLLEGLKNVTLFLLGDGDLSSEIRQLINKKKLPVKMIGYVEENEIIKYYAASDLFVLPSIEDPSPLSPIEAIAAGLPILVSSRIGNLEDVLESGINGWCFDPILENEKGKELVKNISSYSFSRLKEAGNMSTQIYSDKFSTDSCLDKYSKEIYKILHEA